VIFSSQLLISQVNFTAKVSRSTLGVNERFRITFTINKQGADDFTPPSFNNFDVVAGPMQSSNFQNFNGKQSFEFSVSYTLQPKKKGVFYIEPATIEYEGKIISTHKIKMRISHKIVKPIDPNDPSLIAKENVFIVAEISNANPYVGESISVIYKLYMDSQKAVVINKRETKTPSFDGFWNQGIPIKRLTERKGTFKGRTMSYYILRKDVLIPQRAGKLSVSSMEVDLSVNVAIEGRRDFFGRPAQRQISYKTSTGQRTINVKALPEQNKPADFNGAVGNFNFSVNSSKTIVKANESAQIKVKVSGKGNLKLISLPKIITPKGLEQYEPEHKESIRTQLSGLTGYVSDNYTIVPQYRGKYKIPSISFSYFNPKEAVYKTITSQALIINVPDGKLPEEDNTTEQTTNAQKLPSDTDIRHIHTKTKLSKITKQEDFFKSNLFYMLLILPLLSIPLGIYIGKQKRKRDGDIVGNKRRKADRLAKKYLSAAKKQLGQKEPFYIALEKALHNYLKAKLQVETSEISKDKIDAILQDKNVDKPTITQFLKVLNDCDFARYTPSSNLQMEKEYQNAIDIITNLDKQL
jgi:hypothetical protein